MQADRRHVLAAIASIAAPAAYAQSQAPMLVADTDPGHAISPYIFGSNEIGAMDGGPLSATLDADAGVTIRRLGGDLLTAYNWVNNASNAGKNHHHANGAFMLEALKIPRAQWDTPAILIDTMHQASLAMSAKSIVTLPLAPFVAADFGSTVLETESAPSARFVPVRWASDASATDPVDPKVCDVPQLLRKLVARHGDARSGGIHGYLLDNEPAIWFQTHPRLFKERIRATAFVQHAIAAARVIKSIDPSALVLGPASWGATEMVSFQDSPDWPPASWKASFLGYYLDAFRRASESDGRRLLDCLDVHWYPFSNHGSLFRSEDPKLDQARLDSPRALTDAGFAEASWVTRALRHSPDLPLPILPSLQRLIDRHHPGIGLSITEFNYGGSGQLTSGLALADVIGRFSAANVAIATHWGSLAGWLGEAYRLYTLPLTGFGRFGGRFLHVKSPDPIAMPAYAAQAADGAIHLVAINKSRSPMSLHFRFAGGPRVLKALCGFDAAHPAAAAMPITDTRDNHPLIVPPLAARRFVFG